VETHSLGRLRRTKEILRVLKEGKRLKGRFFILYWRGGEGCRTRAAFVAGREVGKAVARNRARRLLREALRGLLPLLSRPIEVVLVASPEAASASFHKVREELEEALKAAGLVGM